MRLGLAVIMLSLASPLAALEMRYSGNFARALLDDTSPTFAELVAEPGHNELAAEADHQRTHWFSRGVGASFRVLIALADQGAGYGGDIAVPFHRNVSATLAAGRISLLHGADSFNGYHFQTGARAYYDLTDWLAATFDVGVTWTKGRTYRSGSMATPEKRWHVRYWGGQGSVGGEVGGRVVRFCWEFTVQVSQAHLQSDTPALFLGLTIGLRVYLPVAG